MGTPVSKVVYYLEVLDGQRSKGIVTDVEIRQGVGEHEIAIVRVEVPRPYTGSTFMEPWPDNTPVTITWGRGVNQQARWWGYVNHHEIASDADSGTTALQFRYVLIGTSAVMNHDVTRSWNAMSYSSVAKQIAKEHNLRAIVHRCPAITSFEAQVGESDFHFLKRLADKAGFRFWVSGPNLYFMDPNILVTLGVNPGIPRFTSNKLQNKLDTLVTFEIVAGQNVPGRVVSKNTVFGVDAKTGKTLKATAGTGVVQQTKTQSATTYAEAKKLAQGSQNKQQNWITAKAMLFGNINVQPNRLIYLEGDALPSSNSGYWLVSKVRHTLKSSLNDPQKDIFVSEVELLRNDVTGIVSDSIQLLRPDYTYCYLNKDVNVWKSNIVTAVSN